MARQIRITLTVESEGASYRGDSKFAELEFIAPEAEAAKVAAGLADSIPVLLRTAALGRKDQGGPVAGRQPAGRVTATPPAPAGAPSSPAGAQPA